MFSNLLSFLLASAAALRRGRFSAGSIPLFCLGTSCCSSLLLLGTVHSLDSCFTSAHSKGHRKFNGRFSSFPVAVRIVAARTLLSLLVMISSIIASFQVPLGELSFSRTTSPFVG